MATKQQGSCLGPTPNHPQLRDLTIHPGKRAGGYFVMLSPPTHKSYSAQDKQENANPNPNTYPCSEAPHPSRRSSRGARCTVCSCGCTARCPGSCAHWVGTATLCSEGLQGQPKAQQSFPKSGCSQLPPSITSHGTQPSTEHGDGWAQLTPQQRTAAMGHWEALSTPDPCCEPWGPTPPRAHRCMEPRCPKHTHRCQQTLLLLLCRQAAGRGLLSTRVT